MLVKPFEPQMLIARVRDLLERQARRRSHRRRRRVPAAPAGRDLDARSVDDYFARLDRAFATLNTSLEPATRSDRSGADAAPAAREQHAST